MGSIFDGGRAMMREAFDYASCLVSYRKEGRTIASRIPAKRGKTVFRYATPAGMVIRSEQKDFILRTRDFGLEPRTGDEIVTEDGDVYVVSAPNSEPCWRWHTSDETEIRIHTKLGA